MNKLRILLVQKEKKPSELAEYLGVSRSLVSKWLNGQATPSKKHDEAICKFFKSSSIEELEQPQIVRCKDCKNQNWVNLETGNVICRIGHGTNPSDWYCADGERK